MVRAVQQGAKQQLTPIAQLLPAILVVGGVICVLADSRGAGYGMFVAAVITPFVLTWSLRRTARRQFAYLCVPTTLHFTADGYEVRTAQQTMSLRWSFLDRVVTGEEFWLFFKGKKQFTGFLPRRAFTPEQQAALDAVLGAK
ncbi:YcxB family protein [Nonomuraea aridisoli]|uniref:YcxB family protein n=1 Tax=Nonomuraea aridisoli TaxID=2070368 RepID=UPI0011B947F2|nr:YcxB family protein [Nonomuraea aridisoli]